MLLSWQQGEGAIHVRDVGDVLFPKAPHDGVIYRRQSLAAAGLATHSVAEAARGIQDSPHHLFFFSVDDFRLAEGDYSSTLRENDELAPPLAPSMKAAPSGLRSVTESMCTPSAISRPDVRREILMVVATAEVPGLVDLGEPNCAPCRKCYRMQIAQLIDSATIGP